MSLRSQAEIDAASLNSPVAEGFSLRSLFGGDSATVSIQRRAQRPINDISTVSPPAPPLTLSKTPTSTIGAPPNKPGPRASRFAMGITSKISATLNPPSLAHEAPAFGKSGQVSSKECGEACRLKMNAMAIQLDEATAQSRAMSTKLTENKAALLDSRRIASNGQSSVTQFKAERDIACSKFDKLTTHAAELESRLIQVRDEQVSLKSERDSAVGRNTLLEVELDKLVELRASESEKVAASVMISEELDEYKQKLNTLESQCVQPIEAIAPIAPIQPVHMRTTTSALGKQAGIGGEVIQTAVNQSAAAFAIGAHAMPIGASKHQHKDPFVASLVTDLQERLKYKIEARNR